MSQDILPIGSSRGGGHRIDTHGRGACVKPSGRLKQGRVLSIAEPERGRLAARQVGLSIPIAGVTALAYKSPLIHEGVRAPDRGHSGAAGPGKQIPAETDIVLLPFGVNRTMDKLTQS
ncbi:hypothetical protein SKAU_G00092250 [Synaphobranchus kaupii]|uniref:Uncharacterized protein n=1 Tax=Synaphobranchus kaupii TaxID=118154 RepID=A0A9Q1J5I6_SYNKA|nr:hypothetical protein SKAU_G00092250 [Synaphobranchus kaupii]